MNSSEQQINLDDFIVEFLSRTSGILDVHREINREHLYSRTELCLIFGIAKQHFDEFKKIVELAEAKIDIHSRTYYSLTKLITSNGFVQSIYPLTHFPEL
jgi:hypothetical protein